MKSRLIACALLVLAWLASGLFIVRANEQALVRRFGRTVLPVRQSGLHYDVPWPFARIDRVNVNAVQTLSIGAAGTTPLSGSGFLREVNVDRQGEFLTGDKNVLNLAINVQYRISDPQAYLTQAEAPEITLRLLVESLAADVVSRAGVDYVHPLGLGELQALLSQQARGATAAYGFGLEVADVTFAAAFPPIEVKAAFLDVSNARAERDRTIQLEQARGEQRVSAAGAQARATRDRAESDRHARIEAAKGAADRFLANIRAFQPRPETADSPQEMRRRTMQRLFAAAMEQILPRLRGKVVLDGAKPFDLTIFPPNEPAPSK